MQYCMQELLKGNLFLVTIRLIAAYTHIPFQKTGCHKARVHYHQNIYNHKMEAFQLLLLEEAITAIGKENIFTNHHLQFFKEDDNIVRSFAKRPAR